MNIAQLLDRIRGKTSSRRSERDWTDRAAVATTASRRESGDEGRKIEDQQGLGAGREGDGKARPF